MIFFIVVLLMELLQVFNKHIPQKKKVFARFQKRGPQDLSKFLLQMIKNAKKGGDDTMLLNAFFIELYDMIYQYVIFDNVKIAKKIMRILEELALPIKYIGEERWKESLRRVRKVRL